MDVNDIIQGVSVAVILIIAVIWVIIRIKHKGVNSACDCGCGGCPLKDKCSTPKKELIESIEKKKKQ